MNIYISPNEDHSVMEVNDGHLENESQLPPMNLRSPGPLSFHCSHKIDVDICNHHIYIIYHHISPMAPQDH